MAQQAHSAANLARFAEIRRGYKANNNVKTRRRAAQRNASMGALRYNLSQKQRAAAREQTAQDSAANFELGGGFMSGVGDFLLKNLDIGGRVVRGLAVGAGELVTGDLDFDDAADQFSGRAHTSDLLEDIGIDGLAGDILGFVGDVATDPLTYLAPNPFTAGGAKGFAKHATTTGLKRVTAQKTAQKTAEALSTPLFKGAKHSGAKNAAAQAVHATSAKAAAREAKEELAEFLARTGPMGPKRRGLANATPDDLVKWGPDNFGTAGLKINVPTTGRLAKAARVPWAKNGPKQFQVLPKSMTDPISGRFSQATKGLRMSAAGQALANKIPGTTDDARAFNKLWEQGGDNAAAGVRGEVLETGARKTVAKVHQGLLAEYVEKIRPLIRGNEHAVIAAIESGQVQGVRGAQEMSDWFKKAAKAADDAGVDINEIDDYFPRHVTDEIMVKKGINPTKHRELRKGQRLPDGTLITADTPAGVRAQADDYAKRSGARDGYFEKNPDKVIPTYLMSLRHKMVKGMTVKGLHAEGFIDEATRLAAKPLSKKAAKKVGKLRDALATLRATHATASDKARAEQSVLDAMKGKTEKQVAELLEQADAHAAAAADDTARAVPEDLNDPQFDELLDPDVEQSMLDDAFPQQSVAKARKTRLEKDKRYFGEDASVLGADAGSTATSLTSHPAFVTNPNFRAKTSSRGIRSKQGRFILDPTKYPDAPDTINGLNEGKAWLRQRLSDHNDAVREATEASLPGGARSGLSLQKEAAGAATRSQDAAGTIMPSVNKQRISDIDDALADPRHATDPHFVPEGFERDFGGVDDLYTPKPPSKAEIARRRDEWVEREADDLMDAAEAAGKNLPRAKATARARAKATRKDNASKWTFEDLNPHAKKTEPITTKQRLEMMRKHEVAKQARIDAAQAHREGLGGLHAVDRPMDMGPATAAMNVEHGGDFGIAAEGRFGLGMSPQTGGGERLGVTTSTGGPLPDDFVPGFYEDDLVDFYMDPTGPDGERLLDANGMAYEPMSREGAISAAQVSADWEARMSMRPGYRAANQPNPDGGVVIDPITQAPSSPARRTAAIEETRRRADLPDEVRQWLPISERPGYDSPLAKYRAGDKAGAVDDLLEMMEDMHPGSLTVDRGKREIFIVSADDPSLSQDAIGRNAKRATERGEKVLTGSRGPSDAALDPATQNQIIAEHYQPQSPRDPTFKPNRVGGKIEQHTGTAAGEDVDQLLRESTQAREEALQQTFFQNRIRFGMPTRQEEFVERVLDPTAQARMLNHRSEATRLMVEAYDKFKAAEALAESRGFTIHQPRSLRGAVVESRQGAGGNWAVGAMQRGKGGQGILDDAEREALELVSKNADDVTERLEATARLMEDSEAAAPGGYTGDLVRYGAGETDTVAKLGELEAMVQQIARDLEIDPRDLLKVHRGVETGNATLVKRAQIIDHRVNGQDTGLKIIVSMGDDGKLVPLSRPMDNTPSGALPEDGLDDALNAATRGERTAAQVEREAVMAGQGRADAVLAGMKAQASRQVGTRWTINHGKIVEGVRRQQEWVAKSWDEAAEEHLSREAVTRFQAEKRAQLESMIGDLSPQAQVGGSPLSLPDPTGVTPAAGGTVLPQGGPPDFWQSGAVSAPAPGPGVLPTAARRPYPGPARAGADSYQKGLNDFTDGWSAWKAARDEEFRIATMKAQLKRNEELKADLQAILDSPDGVHPEFVAQMERKIYHETRAAELMQRAGAEQDVGMRQVAYLEAQAARAHSAVSALDDEIAPVMGNLKDLSPKLEEVAVAELQKGLKRSFADINRPDLMADPDLVDAIVGMNRVTQAGGMKEFLNHYDRLLNFTKAWQIASPGFHFRNFMGGAFNNYLAGMDFGAYRRFFSTRKAWRVATKDGTEELTEQALLRVPAGQRELVGYFDELQPHIGRGIYSAQEVARGVNKSVLQQANPMSSDFKWLTMNQAGGGKVEEILRGTLGLDRMANGRGLEAAFDDVYKYHFDYEALSSFEQKYVKRVIPFYTWTRKNFPLQLEMMVRKPGKYLPYVAAQNNFAGDAQGDTPPWFKDLWATPLNATAGQLPFGLGGLSPSPTDQLFVTPDLPFTRTMTDPIPFDSEGFDPTKPLNMVAPQLKTIPELMMGKKFFGDLPIKGERRVINSGGTSGLGVIPGLIEMLSESGLAKRDKKTGEISVEEKVAHILETAMPPISTIQRLNPASKTRQDAALASIFGYAGLPLRANTQRLQKSTRLGKKFDKADAKAQRKLDKQFVKP